MLLAAATLSVFGAATASEESERVDLWEIACSPASGITAAAEKNGLVARRKSFFMGMTSGDLKRTRSFGKTLRKKSRA